MARFVKAFEQACSGQTLNYTPNGSGAGINEFIGNQTDFGGSDVALSADEHGKAQQRCGSPAWDLPVVFGPIAVTYNVSGVTSLNLDGPTAAKIFNGTIKTWNDPAITALNTGAALPDLPIHVVFRSDQSGTTDNSSIPRHPHRTVHGARAPERHSTGVSVRGPRATTAPRRPSRHPGIDHLRPTVVRSGAEAEHGQDRHVGRSRPSVDQRRSVGKTIAAAKVKGQGNDLVLDTVSFSKPRSRAPIRSCWRRMRLLSKTDSQVGTAVKAFLQATMVPARRVGGQRYISHSRRFKSRLSTAVNAIASSSRTILTATTPALSAGDGAKARRGDRVSNRLPAPPVRRSRSRSA